MTENERLDNLIRILLGENDGYSGIVAPESVEEKRRLLRALMNVRKPRTMTDEFITMPCSSG